MVGAEILAASLTATGLRHETMQRSVAYNGHSLSETGIPQSSSSPRRKSEHYGDELASVFFVYEYLPTLVT